MWHRWWASRRHRRTEPDKAKRPAGSLPPSKPPRPGTAPAHGLRAGRAAVILAQPTPAKETNMSFRSILAALRPDPQHRRTRAAGRRAGFRPRLEPLDDRCLPSANVVLHW